MTVPVMACLAEYFKMLDAEVETEREIQLDSVVVGRSRR
jgi:hypothetical protein